MREKSSNRKKQYRSASFQSPILREFVDCINQNSMTNTFCVLNFLKIKHFFRDLKNVNINFRLPVSVNPLIPENIAQS